MPKAIYTMYKIIPILILISSNLIFSQTTLEADGPGNTYELINNVLAPGYDVVENPECIHPQFGRHIAEVWDNELGKYVFEFYIHVTPDNDRCINFDRQRMEIKTYESSPSSLKGTIGETVTYKWKFKLPVGFKPSSSFTHIHQIKAVGGDDGMPIFTLTPRKGSPNKMELIHDNTTKVVTANLSLFEGVWVECTEVIKIAPSTGTYSLVIKKISDGTTLLAYNNNSIMTIRADNSFIRPKWGIYRSLDHPTDLRDESIRFAGFSIKEGTTSVENVLESIPVNYLLEQNYPNPFNPQTVINYVIPEANYVLLKIYDAYGREVATLADEYKSAGAYSVKFNVGENKNSSLYGLGYSLSSGIYFYTLRAGNYTSTNKMVLMK